jgi:hypothetical protein
MKSRDTISVLHAYDPLRTDLKPELRPDAVKERVEVRLMPWLPQSRYKLMLVEKSLDISIKSCILHEVSL